MFSLGPIDDLLAPDSPSSGRALASLARRRTFEDVKTWLAAGARRSATGESGDPYGVARAHAALAQAFAVRLPGDPHAIAAAIADPAIGAPLRRGLLATEPADERWLALGIWRLLAAIGEPVVHLVAGDPDAHETSGGPIHDRAVEGALTLRAGDAALLACVRVDETPFDDRALLQLREALDLVRIAEPALRTDVDRFAARLVVTDTPPTDLPVWSVGLGVVPQGGGTAAKLAGLVGSVVTHKLHVLLGTEPSTVAIASFRRRACEAAVAEVARTIRLRVPGALAHGVSVAPSSPPEHDDHVLPEVLAPVRAELARLRERG